MTNLEPSRTLMSDHTKKLLVPLANDILLFHEINFLVFFTLAVIWRKFDLN
jgi:hypothetical protein